MTVSPLSLLDLIGQNTATPVTATAGDWQHFQDLLKTALDQNAGADATPPVGADRAVTRALAQAAGNRAERAETSADAQAGIAQADARRQNAIQAETARANADQADAEQAKSANTRRVEKRNAARAAAAADDQTAASAKGAASAPSETGTAETTADATAPDPASQQATSQTSSKKAPASADEDKSAMLDSSNAAVQATKAGATAAGASAKSSEQDSQDNSTPAAPPPKTALDAALKDETPNVAGDPAAAGSAVATAAATVVAALVTAPAPPAPVATGSLADLLSATTDPAVAGHLGAGTSAASERDAKVANTTTAEPGSALFSADGDAAASLAAGVAPAPAAQGSNSSSEQGSGQKQEHGSPEAATTEDRTSRSDDSQATPAVQQTAAPAPNVVQPLVAPPVTLGAALTAGNAQRTEAAAISDTATDADGTNTPVGFADRTATSLSPLRPSETPSSAASPYAPTQAPLPVEQVALAIGRLTNGARSFSMQLNPEHLGAVDVRMEVDAKGKTKVAITAERPETLALLKLDSHHLVKALQDSGVSADQASLSFSLREQGSNAAGDRRSGSGQSNRGASRTGTDDTQDTEATPVRMSLSRHLYDIHA